jgi:hypothetical protein
VACPRCGYNLRDLARPVCPECCEDLVLAVGAKRLRFGWFLATVSPCIFSGIAALLLLFVIIAEHRLGSPPPPWFVWGAEAFGWLSGVCGVCLILCRHRFVAMRQHRQAMWAGLVWAVHLAAFVVLVVSVL